MPYRFTKAPGTFTDIEELRLWLEGEFQRVADAQSEVTSVELRPIFVAPTRPREGMIVYADGTSWNPGSGKGPYVYNGTTWRILS